MKFQLIVTFGLIATCLNGCYEPPYRYDVRGNGEGGVDIQKVPNDPAQQPAMNAAPPPQAPTNIQRTPTEQQRIDELESKVRALSAENEKLKHQSTTAPTTMPAKE